jgi:thymidylate synthase (FAD)
MPQEEQSLIERISVPELDAILGEQLPVLDKGFVRVVDYMGGDASIVQAARVSYGKGTKHVSEDRGLIRYLMRHWHTTPFEMCEIKLHVRVPMDCWRQWIRHRTANVNEYSTRYSIAIDDKQETPATEWRSQATDNKQGSGDYLDEETGRRLSRREKQLHQMADGVYRERLDAGVAKEQARKDLPLSTYTEAYWKVDFHNLLNFLRLRMDGHAQQEIREYATIIGEQVVARWCPIAWEAFNDYQLGATSLTRLEREIITAITRNPSYPQDATLLASKWGWLEKKADGSLKNNRERTECEDKLRTLGLTIPWVW